MARDVRAVAATVVADVIAGRSLNRALPPRVHHVAPRDRALLQELCYGTLRHAPQLDAVLAQLLDKPLRDKDRNIQALLLCGLYQLHHMRTPDHAAVSATVDAARALQKPWAGRLANAVLRRFQRQSTKLLQALTPAAAASHPNWLFERIHAQWPAQADAILQANNQPPPLCLRVHPRSTNRQDYAAQLREAGLAAEPTAFSPDGLRLSRAVDVTALPGFASGAVSVQDEAAQLAAVLLNPQAGERLLDACAAPGGKTCHLLERQSALGELVAMDSDTVRLSQVEENLQRLNLTARTIVGDGTAPPSDLAAASFDRILVDAPCSGSGVIRRHPDIKLLRRREDIVNLAKTQLAILHGLWPTLKQGGVLLYATCSIFREENTDVVAQFLAAQPEASLPSMTADWGEPCTDRDGKLCGQQLLPCIDGPDGMFYALLQKQAAWQPR